MTTTTRKSARKKQNRFEELGEAVEERKDADVIDPNSSLTGDFVSDQTPNTDSNLKESFISFQNKTTAQFSNMEFNFRQMTDTLTKITATLADLHSRQNDSESHQTPDDDNMDGLSTNKSTDDPTDNHRPSSPIPFGSTHTYVDTTTPARNNTTFLHHNHGSGPVPNLHKFWKVVRDDNLEPHRFHTLIKDIVLHDDSLQALRHFYNRIRHAMHTSFKKHVDVLPSFGELDPVQDLTTLLIPSNPDYAGYTLIKSVYNWFGDSIANLLFDPKVVNNKNAPQAHHIIITNSNTDNGWKLLFTLLSKRCPFMGGMYMDVATEITLLKLHENDKIHTFYRRVQDIQTKLLYSRENVDKTRSLKLYLKVMATSKDHFALLQGFIADLNIHINNHGANVPHPDLTCTIIYEYLLSIEAPE